MVKIIVVEQNKEKRIKIYKDSLKVGQIKQKPTVELQGHQKKRK